MKRLKKFITWFLCISFTIYAAILSPIVYTGKTSKPQKSDVIIVLGCQIWGTSPSPLLEYRLQKALELYKDNYAQTIIVSGGQGSNEVTSEAQTMKKWLVAHGVEQDKVVEEGKSTSTYENLCNSREILQKNNMKTAIIVSNNFHIFRSLFLCRRVGIKASAAPAKSLLYLQPYYYTREVASVVKSYLLDR